MITSSIFAIQPPLSLFLPLPPSDRSTLKSMMGETGTEEARSYKAPVPGDHVVCMHQRSAYFLATIVKFDPATMKYTVEWDDGDPTDRVQSYKVSRREYSQIGSWRIRDR